MSQLDQSVKYMSSHEWARVEGKSAVVGISDHAQGLLGDLVYVELPVVGKVVKKGQEIAVVESVKAASDVYAPLSGTITEVNANLSGSPELVNTAPYGDGWICKIALSDANEVNELLSAEQYSVNSKQ